ncbi:SCO2322 family protein [Streptomyces physcomitrii]|uniref:SCO2322 family protein n=1 Tax=Streptomyces physcomitrii TaxID=2724184 RepID=UPI0035E45BC9
MTGRVPESAAPADGRRTPAPRRATALAAPVAAVLTAVLAVLLAAAPAGAAGYRYWSFWEREDNAWRYASQGPSLTRPADGSVQGFRFSVSEDSKDAAKPRGEAGFGTVCADTPAEKGRKRLALVLDFGTPADAPGRESPPRPRTVCARVPADATTAEALAAVARPLRYDSKALLCAIAGYPKSGCGEQVSGEAEHEPGTRGETGDGSGDEDGGPSFGLIGGGALVVLVAVAAGVQAKRRRG